MQFKTRIKLFSRNPYNMDKEELEKLKQKFKHLKSKKVKRIGSSIESGSPRLLSMMNKGYKIPDLLAFWN